MPDPSTYRPASGTIPDTPGVYRFRDPSGRVIYVGKAKSLRQRLNSYFADVWTLHARTQQMVTTAAKVDWVTVGTEVEALQLEYNWIKEYDPRFNVRYRDDKSYPYLAVTLDEEYPRLQVMRGAKRKGVRYFGPYAHAWAIRETLDLLLRVFPARTCSSGVFKRAGQIGRPCLLGYIGKCSRAVRRPGQRGRAPPDRRGLLRLHGRQDRHHGQAAGAGHVRAASDELDFERAARLRDDLGALRRAMEKQAVVLGDGTDADVVAFADDPLEAAVQVFHVRGGRVRGQRGWVVEKTEDLTTGDLVHHFCTQIYGDEAGAEAADLPRELLVPELPADADALPTGCASCRGSRVSICGCRSAATRRPCSRPSPATPAGAQPAQAAPRRRPDRAQQALEEIAEALGMADGAAAHRVLDFADPGHRRGREHGGLRGRPGPQERIPAVRRSTARPTTCPRSPRCCAAGSPATSRRPRSRTRRRPPSDERDRRGIDPTTGRPRKFAYPPQLVVVDGGPPQVNAAAQVLLDDSASPTHRRAAWPSGWRRCGCPTTSSR